MCCCTASAMVFSTWTKHKPCCSAYSRALSWRICFFFSCFIIDTGHAVIYTETHRRRKHTRTLTHTHLCSGAQLGPNHQRFLSKHMGLELVALPLISPQGLHENAPSALLLPSPLSQGLSLASWCQELL